MKAEMGRNRNFFKGRKGRNKGQKSKEANNSTQKQKEMARGEATILDR